MARLKNTILAGATLFAALGTGFVMQSSPVAELRYGPQASQAKEAQTHTSDPVYSGVNPFSGITALELTSIAYTSAPAMQLQTMAAEPVMPRLAPGLLDVEDHKRDDLSEALVLASASVAASGLDAVTSDCHATLVARPMAAAMVDLTLSAPCEAGARVTLHHNGMMITEEMDEAGVLAVQLPALSQTAVYMAAFDSGLTAMAKTEITSLDIYDRVVVQWQGPGEMQIHALEFGANYGDAGHVCSQAPRDMEQAALGKGGFMTEHGRAMPDQDLRAQVYTFPSGTSAQSGDIVLSVETEVTAQTCGRLMEGQALQIMGGGALSVKDLTIDIPGCDATGGFLVLKNLLQDLKIARN
ncbi:MAG: hypothetical protein B7X55_07570 [Rhodobacterales bacterium 34-62-10]|nr:MAG: hypothetical protein B7X55_07570 [Rhodobacterales bacterium 34-62-10]